MPDLDQVQAWPSPQTWVVGNAVDPTQKDFEDGNFFQFEDGTDYDFEG